MAPSLPVSAALAALAAASLPGRAWGAENFDPQAHLKEKRDPNRNTLLVIYNDPDTPEFPKAFRARAKAAKQERADWGHLYSRLAKAVRLFEEEEVPSSLNLSVAVMSNRNEWFDLAGKEWGFHRDELPLALYLVGSEEKGLKYKKELKGELEAHQFEADEAPSRRAAYALRQFLRKSLDHTADEWLKSDPVSEELPATGEMLQLVGNSFKDQVLGGTRHTLVMFGAPWCGFSKKLQSKLRAISSTLAVNCADPHRASLCIAEIDHSSNDHPASSGIGHITALPQLYLYRALPEDQRGTRAPEPILVPREHFRDSAESLLSWLKEQEVVSNHVTKVEDEF